MRRTIASMVVTAVLLVYAACDKDSTPSGPDNGSSEQEEITIDGRVLFKYSILPHAITSISLNVHIVGAVVDTTFQILMIDSEYSFSGPGGMYSVTITIAEPYNTDYAVLPASRTVTGTSGIVEVDPFLILTQEERQSYEANALGVIYGRILYNDDNLGPTSITLATPDGDVVTFSGGGRFTFFDIPHGNYRLTPANDYFTFNPPDSTVTLDGYFVNADFTGEYTGPERFTISCRVLSNVQEYIGTLSARMIGITSVRSFTYSDEDGYIISKKLIPGNYNVEISCSKSDVPSDWFEDKVVMNTSITDHNVDLGEITLNYIGYIYYTVNGTVTDTSGGGIEGVTVTLRNEHYAPVYGTSTKTTGADGVFTISGVNFSTHGDIDMTVTASKSGWTFNPPLYTLIHSLDASLTSTVFTTPFTGAQVIMADYFPLSVGASWTYAHTADGVPSGSITASAGTSFTAGGETWIPLSGYMFAGFAGYRVDGAALYFWNGQQQATWAALDLATWNFGQINGTSARGEWLTPEDVTVPVGTYEQCRVLRITVPPDNPSAEVTTYWLAEGVGPVKVEYTATSAGTVVQRVTDELVSYQTP